MIRSGRAASGRRRRGAVAALGALGALVGAALLAANPTRAEEDPMGVGGIGAGAGAGAGAIEPPALEPAVDLASVGATDAAGAGAGAAPASSAPAPSGPLGAWLLSQRTAARHGPTPFASLLALGAAPDLSALVGDLGADRGTRVAELELCRLMVGSLRGDRSAQALLDALGALAGVDLRAAARTLTDHDAFYDLVYDGSATDAALVRALDDPDAQRALVDAVLVEVYRAGVAGRAGSGPALDALLGGGPGSPSRVDLPARLAAALEDGDLARFVEADPARVARAEAIARSAAPPDLAPAANVAAERALAQFRDWGRFEHDVIIVPGYTPRGERAARPGVHEDARARLEEARRDFVAGKAPFILLTGSNVRPEGTPYYEALEMRRVLVEEMGVPAERVIVETRARHSTTNLRNAGRFMLAHGMSRALITTTGMQDFYFSNPTLSFFHAISRGELGHRVGDLGDVYRPGEDFPEHDPRHSWFRPSADVLRTNWRDPRDP